MTILRNLFYMTLRNQMEDLPCEWPLSRLLIQRLRWYPTGTPPALSCPPLNAACNPCCWVLPTLSLPGRCRESLRLPHGRQLGQKCLGAYSIPRDSPQAMAS